MQRASVYYLSDPAEFQEKERLYHKTRRLEGRILPDEEVKMLPKCAESSPYVQEWHWRKRTCQRFLDYVKGYFKRIGPKPGTAKFKILDLGCGNGWMSNHLAEQTEALVWAVDLNQEELEQAARLFARKNLHFAYADVDVLPQIPNLYPELSFPETFDLIVLAASVQYFPDLSELLATLRKLLSPHGEIHFLDSHFYPGSAESIAAKHRTLAYYQQLGVPEMARYYHHHIWKELKELGAKNLHNTLKTKLLQGIKYLAPFPWVRLKRVVKAPN